MPDLETALAAELEELLAGRGLDPEEAESVEDLAPYFGKTPRTQNPAMAAALADTGDKSSSAYRNALRSIQRYRSTGGQTRRPNLDRLRKLIDAALRKAGSITARIAGDIQVSSDRRDRVCPVGPPVVLDSDSSRRMAAAHDAGDSAGAADAFLDGFAGAYGVAIEVHSVDSLELGEAGS